MAAKTCSLVLSLALLGVILDAHCVYAQSDGGGPPADDSWIAGDAGADPDEPDDDVGTDPDDVDGPVEPDGDVAPDVGDSAAPGDAGTSDGGPAPATDPNGGVSPSETPAADPTPGDAPADDGSAPITGGFAPPSTDAPDTAAGAPVDPAPRDTVLSADEVEDGEHVGRHNRFRLFYAEVSVGYSWLNLGLVRNENLDPQISRVKDTGFAVGGGLGFFVSFLTLGVQAEVAFHNAFKIGTVTFDVGFRIPTPHIEPYLRVGVGYAFLFGQDLYPDVDDEAAIRGIAVDVGVGFDFMITEAIAIGVGVDAALFNVRRSGVSGAPIISDRSVDLSEDGNAIGLQVSGLVQASFHF